MRRGVSWSVIAVLAMMLSVSYWLGRQHAWEPVGHAAPPAAHPISETAADGDLVASARSLPDDIAAGHAVRVLQPDLPAKNVPIASWFDELAERARGGDSRAACRLGAELVRCRRNQERAQKMHAMAESMMASPDSSQADESMIQTLARTERQVTDVDRVCAGLSPAQLARAFEFQRLAAERGGSNERLWYAAAPALDVERFLDDLPEWNHYRAVAYGYLEQALAAGNPRAPAALARVHLPADPMLQGHVASPLRIPDRHRHLVYRELSRMLAPRHDLFIGVGLGGDEFVDISAMAEGDADMEAVRLEAKSLHHRFYPGVERGMDASVNSSAGPFFDQPPDVVCGG